MRTIEEIYEEQKRLYKDVKYSEAIDYEKMCACNAAIVFHAQYVSPTSKEMDAIEFLIDNPYQEGFASEYCVQSATYGAATDNSCELATYWRERFDIVLGFLSRLKEQEVPSEKDFWRYTILSSMMTFKPEDVAGGIYVKKARR